MTERKGPIELVILLALVLCAFLVGLGLYQQLPAARTAPVPPETRTFNIDLLAQKMATIRGLSLLQPISWETLDATTLQQKIVDFRSRAFDQGDTASYQEVLRFLGLLPSSTSLFGLLTDLYGQEALGFYDTDTKKLYLLRQDSYSFSEQLILAHELAHDLEDQHFDLSRFSRPAFQDNDDALVAAQCLVEGDASWAQSLYLEANQSAGTSLSLFLAGLNQPQKTLASAPAYIQSLLRFPYQGGLPFVQRLYQDGGWTAVNQAFSGLPQSTEQILHPEKYLEGNDPPIKVEIPAYPDDLSDWTLVRDNVLGEFDLRTWFDTFLPSSEAERDAAGWGGCRYQLWRKGDQHIFLLNSRWDSADDAWEAENAIEIWLKYRFQRAPEIYFQGGLFRGPQEIAILYPDGASLQLVMAPDEDLALRLLKTLP